MSNYTIWCEKLQEDIEFDSFINDANIEMFNLTTIAKQFNYTNKNIVDWFNMNISTLNIIDSIITEEELNDNEELLCISDNTIIKKGFIFVFIKYRYKLLHCIIALQQNLQSF